MPVRVESGTGKGGAQSYLKQCAGLTLLASVGQNVRGLCVARDRLFAVTEDRLLEVASDWTTTDRGYISPGDVEMAANNTQLGIVTGDDLFVFDLDSNGMSNNPANWQGSASIEMLDGYGVFIIPNSSQFYLSANQDLTSFDGLQFASVESAAGNLVSVLFKHRELVFLKSTSGETWYDAGASDFPLARNDSAYIGVGCAARATLRRVNDVAYWLGRDGEGTAVVFGMPGYAPQRISSHALEEQLSSVTDLSTARAWTYHQEGLSFYVLNVPGLETTWVYEVASGIWHERGEWNNGWSQWRATSHAVAFGKHIVADNAGNLYELSPSANTYGASPMVRDWISPHAAVPQMAVQRFGSFEVLCDVGGGASDGSAAHMLFRYSNDGGKTWTAWQQLSLGAIGQFKARARATMLGSARDRVWNFRV